MNQKVIFHLLVLAMPIILGSHGIGKENKRVDIKILNSGSDEVRDAGVSFGEYSSLGGCVGPGASKTHMFFEHPISKKAVVHWTDAKGKDKSDSWMLRGFTIRKNLERYALKSTMLT